MYKLFLYFCCLVCSTVVAQPKLYTTANAHSHNDYEKPNPFHEAYKQGFGSIEADIFLLNESENLFVAHHNAELSGKRRTLDLLYLQPLAAQIRQNKGYVYKDKSQSLQLLIDIKTDAVPTLKRLIEVLQKYPEIIRAANLKLVISGNRPAPDSFVVYPPFIYFDGVVGVNYSSKALSRIPLFSANFRDFSKWDGKGSIPEAERVKIANAVTELHQKSKPVRFWGAPDGPDAWKEFIKMKADFINTDRIAELSKFLSQYH